MAITYDTGEKHNGQESKTERGQENKHPPSTPEGPRSLTQQNSSEAPFSSRAPDALIASHGSHSHLYFVAQYTCLPKRFHNLKPKLLQTSFNQNSGLLCRLSRCNILTKGIEQCFRHLHQVNQLVQATATAC
jgi:hypothetical protein